jgi:hypothetical protein
MNRARKVGVPPRGGRYLRVGDDADGRTPPTLPLRRYGGLSMTLHGAGHSILIYHWTPEQWAAWPEADRPGGATPCTCCPAGGKCHHEVVTRPV